MSNLECFFEKEKEVIALAYDIAFRFSPYAKKKAMTFDYTSEAINFADKYFDTFDSFGYPCAAYELAKYFVTKKYKVMDFEVLDSDPFPAILIERMPFKIIVGISGTILDIDRF